MRVVAGELRGRRLIAPDGLDTRPTTDRVREAVFNSLGSMDLVVDARFADLYAGTGALGIEALSRGAAHCTFVERDARAIRALRANVDALGLGDRSTIVAADAMAAIARLTELDVALADPPYGFDAWTELLAAIPAPVAVLESGAALPDPPAGWSVLRAKRYGRTFVTVLSRTGPGEADELP